MHGGDSVASAEATLTTTGNEASGRGLLTGETASIATPTSAAKDAEVPDLALRRGPTSAVTTATTINTNPGAEPPPCAGGTRSAGATEELDGHWCWSISLAQW